MSGSSGAAKKLLLTMHKINVALSHFCCRATLQCQMSRKSAMNNRHCQFECEELQYSERYLVEPSLFIVQGAFWA